MSELKLTEEMAQIILDTDPIKIKESGIFNDMKLSEKERIKHAKKIMESRK